jgi:LacI family transcriptional regulator
MARVGIQEIARLAKVSIGTVDRALHGRKRISERTRKRILRIAQQVGYKPNLAARALSAGRGLTRIGVCIPREIHFYFDQLREGIMAEARRHEHLGVEIVHNPTERLGLRESEKFAELIGRGIRAAVLVPGDPERLAPIINEAERSNIRVMCVDTDAAGSSRSSVVCVDAEVSGRLAAELMASFVPAGSEVAMITGMLQTEAHSQNTKGFCDAFPLYCDGGKVVEVVEAHDDEEEALRKFSAVLQQRPRLAGVYVSTANCLPILRALRARKLGGRIKVITSDLFRKMVPYFDRGIISASIYERPYLQGQIAIRLLVDHLIQGRPLPERHYVAPEIVMRSTLHLFRELRQPPAAGKNG